jgi:hypothetical protein
MPGKSNVFAKPFHDSRKKRKNATQTAQVNFIIFLQVHTPPAISLDQSSFNLVQGDTITIPCDVQGEPRPRIRWFLNDEELVDAVIAEDGGLVLDSVDERHRGVFKCVAENELGKEERLISLNIHTAPVIEGSELVSVCVGIWRIGLIGLVRVTNIPLIPSISITILYSLMFNPKSRHTLIRMAKNGGYNKLV